MARAGLALALAVVAALTGGCRRQVSPGGFAPALGPVTYGDISPRWSPSGDRIAFLRRWSDGRASVMVAGADLTHPTVLTPPAPLDPNVPIRAGRDRVTGLQQVAWSPDGRRIVYPRAEEISRDEGDTVLAVGLWEVSAAGGPPHALAAPDEHKPQALTTYRSVAWSPTGARFAFIGRSDRGDTALYIRPAAPSPRADDLAPLPRFDSSLDADLPAWSPDGQFLAFRHADSRAMTADTVEHLRIVEPGGPQARDVWSLTPAGYGAPSASRAQAASPRIVEIAWAPSSSKLAVTVTPDPGHPAVRELWVLAAGGNPRPRRLPGSWIGAVWLGERRLGALRRQANGALGIAVVDAASGEATALFTAPSDDCDWSPDRSAIVFGSPNVAGAAASGSLRVLKTGLRSTGRAPGSKERGLPRGVALRVPHAILASNP